MISASDNPNRLTIPLTGPSHCTDWRAEQTAVEVLEPVYQQYKRRRNRFTTSRGLEQDGGSVPNVESEILKGDFDPLKVHEYFSRSDFLL